MTGTAAARVRWVSGSETPPVRTLTYPRGSLLVVGGLPGAGKSTMLRRLNLAAVIVGAESVAAELVAEGVDLPTPASPRVTERILDHLSDELGSGHTVILDVPAMFPHLRRSYADEARRTRSPCHLLLINADANQAHDGQLQRGERILKPSVMVLYSDLREELFDELRTEPDEVMGVGNRYYQSVTVLDRAAAAQIESIDFV